MMDAPSDHSVTLEHTNDRTVCATGAGAAVVNLRNIKVQYKAGGPFILDIDALTVSRGERVALIGPSGAGKTTLLRLLNGYVRPRSGEMEILGYPMHPRTRQQGSDRRTRAIRRRVGFVFQDFSLVERATVFQNVLWGRLGRVHPFWSLLGWFPEDDKRAAMAAIAEVDLLPQTGQRVDTLSGGQQQRVGVARVLAQEAEIILVDEPVSNLDPALADDVLRLLAAVSQRHEATLIMSLHQPRLAQRYADRIIGLRNGRVVYNEQVAHFDDLAIHTIYGRDMPIAEAGVDKISVQSDGADGAAPAGQRHNGSRNSPMTTEATPWQQ